jgi:hypothetical protein
MFRRTRFSMARTKEEGQKEEEEEIVKSIILFSML